MEYIIELQFDLKKVKNTTSTKEFLRDLAVGHECLMEYFIHEIDGHSRTIDNNICIYHISFKEEKLDNLINLIKLIKSQIDQLENVFIDCIYEDGESSNFIYASPSYLKSINADKKEKNRIYNQLNPKSESHKKIMKALTICYKSK